jgi:hypothetical protein
MCGTHPVPSRYAVADLHALHIIVTISWQARLPTAHFVSSADVAHSIVCASARLHADDTAGLRTSSHQLVQLNVGQLDFRDVVDLPGSNFDETEQQAYLAVANVQNDKQQASVSQTLA